MSVITNPAACGIGGGTNTAINRRVQLLADYSVQAVDDGTLFWAAAGTTWNLTIPAGLSTPPFIAVMPPNTGSITLVPTGGVLLAGAATNVAVNLATYPSGVTVVPYYDQVDKYGLGIPGTAFSTLTGAPTDNAALATKFGLYGLLADLLATGMHKTPLNVFGNYAPTAADNGRLVTSHTAGNISYRIQAGLGNNFYAIVACYGAGGITFVAVAGGTTPTLTSYGTPTTITNKTLPNGGVAIVYNTGDSTENYIILPLGPVAMTA